MKKIFPKINFILGNNAVEARGVKSNFFGVDLTVLGDDLVKIKSL